MTYLRQINWPFTLACLAIAIALACFSYQYLDMDYFSSGVVGLFGWIGAVVASFGEGEEKRSKV